MGNTFLSKLGWRNAEKNFDASKKVSEEDLGKILEAVHMAPSSYGLQPYHVYVVGDDEIKGRLKENGI